MKYAVVVEESPTGFAADPLVQFTEGIPERPIPDALLAARRDVMAVVRDLAEIEEAYVDPDATRPSAHDELREIRTRWRGETAIEVVVDTIDGRVVTTWRKQRGR